MGRRYFTAPTPSLFKTSRVLSQGTAVSRPDDPPSLRRTPCFHGPDKVPLRNITRSFARHPGARLRGPLRPRINSTPLRPHINSTPLRPRVNSAPLRTHINSTPLRPRIIEQQPAPPTHTPHPAPPTHKLHPAPEHRYVTDPRALLRRTLLFHGPDGLPLRNIASSRPKNKAPVFHNRWLARRSTRSKEINQNQPNP